MRGASRGQPAAPICCTILYYTITILYYTILYYTILYYPRPAHCRIHDSPTPAPLCVLHSGHLRDVARLRASQPVRCPSVPSASRIPPAAAAAPRRLGAALGSAPRGPAVPPRRGTATGGASCRKGRPTALRGPRRGLPAPPPREGERERERHGCVVKHGCMRRCIDTR